MAIAHTPVHRSRKIEIGDVLVLLRQRGILNARSFQQLRANLREDDRRHPLVQLAERNVAADNDPNLLLTVDNLTRLVADSCNLPYVRIDPLKIDVEAITSLVSQAYATRFQFLPLSVTDEEVVVATAEPYLDEWEGELRPVLKRRIVRVMANPADIARYLKEFYGVSKSISGAATSRAADRQSLVQNFEQLTELGQIGEPDANDRHIVHLVDWLLQYAFEQRASDIHIEPRREQSHVRFRIDGKLHLVHQLDTRIVAAIIGRIKSVGRMDVADKRRPQDGRLKTKTPRGREVELRLSTMPTTFGEKMVMRIFDPEKLAQPFRKLGFSSHDHAQWERMTAHSHGIILVTGPTGSGKTTTLYSALKRLARPELNICTIEDPIEMVEPAFNQMQVQPSIDLDFAAGVRTLLRQDPDIIMVGEIRDRETAEIAVQAALTGHLVLSTLHTNDSTSAITRLVDIGVPPFLIGATLLGVVAQRLVRLLCPKCKVPVNCEPAAWQALVAPHRLPAPDQTFGPAGCDDCRNTGYFGREGVYEMLSLDSGLQDMIAPGLAAHDLRRAALKAGMMPLRVAGARKVASGHTSLEEVLGVVPPAEISTAAG